MTYEEAIAQAKAGKSVMRQGWCWIVLKYEYDQPDNHNPKFYTESEEGKIMFFVPSREERMAKDWMVVE